MLLNVDLAFKLSFLFISEKKMNKPDFNSVLYLIFELLLIDCVVLLLWCV